MECSEPKVVVEAAAALVSQGRHDARIGNKLVECLKGENPPFSRYPTAISDSASAGVRSRAASALGDLGAPAAISIPTLLTTLNDSDIFTALASIRALAKLQHSCPQAKEALMHAMIHESRDIRIEARRLLAGCPLELTYWIKRWLQR